MDRIGALPIALSSCRLCGGHGVPAVGSGGGGRGWRLPDGRQGAVLFHQLVLLDLPLPALVAAERHLAPARHAQQQRNSLQLAINHSWHRQTSLTTEYYLKLCG